MHQTGSVDDSLRQKHCEAYCREWIRNDGDDMEAHRQADFFRRREYFNSYLHIESILKMCEHCAWLNPEQCQEGGLLKVEQGNSKMGRSMPPISLFDAMEHHEEKGAI